MSLQRSEGSQADGMVEQLITTQSFICLGMSLQRSGVWDIAIEFLILAFLHQSFPDLTSQCPSGVLSVLNSCPKDPLVFQGLRYIHRFCPCYLRRGVYGYQPIKYLLQTPLQRNYNILLGLISSCPFVVKSFSSITKNRCILEEYPSIFLGENSGRLQGLPFFG